ncbi:ATPase [bacterium]|nr:ATPase [bacterium]
MKMYLDAGTTWSKIISTKEVEELREFFVKALNNDEKYYYILPSAKLKNYNFEFEKTTGHMSGKNGKKPENEIISLVKGVMGKIDKNALVLDLGSRDAKWIKLKDGKFFDLDWNTSCAAATGATVEMLLNFYNVKTEDLIFNEEKYPITCGIFGLEKIMDDVSNGVDKKDAISKFIHGIAFNTWKFAKNPEKIYLSGGFCQNECFVNSLSKYCEVKPLGRFVLVEGLME